MMMMQQQQQRGCAESPRPSSVSSVQSNASSGRSTGKRPRISDICVGEELKISVHIALERFRLNEEQKELEFPSSLTSTERAYIHCLCTKYSLKSRSHGKGSNRYLTVSKKDGSQIVEASASFQLARNSRHQIHMLVQRFPLTNKERQDLQPRIERGITDCVAKELNKTTTGRLNNGVPQVPPKRSESDLTVFRETLPVMALKDEILTTLNNNRVMLISGETGSGKTTQVPQLILDDCAMNGRPCRILCTQPRRISALSVAERVAAERGEKIGQTVGYQIRLESRVSPKTLLTFCTNGVLLRTLMGGGENSMSTVTHILLDEVHERDRFCDFLLIAIRDIVVRFKHIKIILMSAALNTKLFVDYFAGCPVINIPGKLFDVQEFFLGDILKWTKYTNKTMEKYEKEADRLGDQQRLLNAMCARMTITDRTSDEPEIASYRAAIQDSVTDAGEEKDELEPWIVAEMDELLANIWLTGNDEGFDQIFHLILSENVSVDYQSTETTVTPLMVAAGRGFYTIVEQLLSLGANVNIRARNDWTAMDWAKRMDRTDVLELLEAHLAANSDSSHDEALLVKKESQALTPEEKDLLNAYHLSFDDEEVDLDLIMTLLIKIHQFMGEGAILIFLPGYMEIVNLRNRIIYDEKCFGDNSRSYSLFLMHSAMQTQDQKKVFKTSPPGVRKIILATNIAETSITINDVVFVIDSGKVKEKSYDALTSVTMLKKQWITKASAIQRKGRAGRCRVGVCYHLFSKVRFGIMQEFPEPEILRYPLQELCLHTKLLTPSGVPIADFLAKAPEPPAFLLTRNAVTLLKQIDALDQWEDLTELGHHLADLPVEPQYGKMVLYSVVLKCLDPVLTISCALAYRDPFNLATQPSQKRASMLSRKSFAAGTFSDHMALLRAFQSWQKARADGWEKSFCDKNFISGATMEMILGMRTQLLGQLRASGFVRARGGGDIRDLNTNSENWAVVKAALLAGMYPNLIRVDQDKKKLTTLKESKVRLHYSSVLHPGVDSSYRDVVKSLPTDWLLFEEMTRSHRMAHVRCCSVVSPIAVCIFTGPAKLPVEAVNTTESMPLPPHIPPGFDGSGDYYTGDVLSSESDGENEIEGTSSKTTIKIDDFIAFKVDSEAASLALQLRQKWHSLFLRRMRAPAKPWSPVDENVIRTVINVLTNEEQALGLQQPAGIGQRPRPMSNECAAGDSNWRASFDGDITSDDSSSSGSKNWRCSPYSDSNSKMWRSATPPKRKDLLFKRGSDERFDMSSVRSGSGSGHGSLSGGSGQSSLRGSASSTPCTSPQPLNSPGRFADPGSLLHPSRFFVIKSSNHKSLDISYMKGIWAVPQAKEAKLIKYYKEGKEVYLVFSVQGSGHFQGYARMISLPGKERSQEFSGSGQGSNFVVEWIKRANLPFQQTHYLINPWNENRRVQVSRDGQEIEPTVGEQLIALWDRLPNIPPKGAERNCESRGSDSSSPPAAVFPGSYPHHSPYGPRQMPNFNSPSPPQSHNSPQQNVVILQRGNNSSPQQRHNSPRGGAGAGQYFKFPK
ncbi:3'-5' RNA helicase YTHDC2-like [Tubulanus polymorphus]|uniref:3'-5' RNA helicase YTHDC2-like n=1 Tax=Tubulanus polymorphus TaxID=672921 RepID=UPI003DA3B081